MAKYRDTRQATTPPEVRRIEGESWRQRHRRRHAKATNKRSIVVLQHWCDENDATFRLENDEHHFIVNPPTWPLLGASGAALHFAQWWPSTAKLVFGCRFKAGVHCHDVGQLIGEMELILNDPKRRRRLRYKARRDWSARYGKPWVDACEPTTPAAEPPSPERS